MGPGIFFLILGIVLVVIAIYNEDWGYGVFACAIFIASSIIIGFSAYQNGKIDGKGMPVLRDILNPGDTFTVESGPVANDQGGPKETDVLLRINGAKELTAVKFFNEILPKEGKAVKLVNSKDSKEQLVIVPISSEFAKLGEKKEEPSKDEKDNTKAEKTP